ncbi:MAG: hypothetical protein SFU86_18910 [Pirellulaceae bacterium]|nr:hypothetical protein [Pirellulaceae bacterium]
MTRSFVGFVVGLMLCLTVSLAHGQARGKGGEKGGGRPGGGERPGGERGGANFSGGKPGGSRSPGGSWAPSKPLHYPGGSPQGFAAEGVGRRNPSQPSGAEGAAAERGVANRNAPKTTGAEGAAAGAAAVDRRQPTATGAEGAAAGAAAADRRTPTATGAEGAAAGYAAVRDSFDRHDLYGQDWHAANPGAWAATGWVAGAAWTPTAWAGLASHFGYGNSPPISYNYGTNVTCVNGNVVLDGQNVGTAEEFGQQAADLAQAGAAAEPADTDKWLPLGVFALVQNEQQHPQLILQIAINQNGNLRGNYTDETTDNTLPLQGAVDQKTQRAAWTVGSNTSCVMEAGLSNLTQSEAPALLHKNGTTERWILVRLEQPK